LWGEAWINLLMEMADAPRYTKKKHVPSFEGSEQLKQALGR
jgi:hypothetical protein